MNIDATLPDSGLTTWDASADETNHPDPDQHGVILRYLPLVRTVVRRVKCNLPTHFSADELYSIGVTGLISAARKFNSETEGTFGSFAKLRIRGAIIDELRRNDHCSRRARVDCRDMQAAIREIEQRLGRVASVDEICSSLGWTHEKYFKTMDAANVRVISLEGQVDSDEDSSRTVCDILADAEDETARDRMEKEELVNELAERIAALPEIPRKVLAMHYHENMRFSEIAPCFGLSQSRISQIHQETITRLKKWLESKRD